MLLPMLEPPLVIRRTAGEEMVYRLKGNFEGDGAPWSCDAEYRERTESVSADGTVTLLRTPIKTTINVTGDPQDVLGGPVATLLLAADGELREHRTDPPSRGSARAAALLMFLPPPGELTNNMTWNRDRPAGGEHPAIVRRYEFLGVEDRVGKRTVKVKLIAKEATGPSPGSVEATFWVRPEDGSVQSIDGRWVRMPMDGDAAPLVGPFTIERQ